MKVYLHVGMPKCASSTIQRFFHDNSDQHARLGFCYPESLREKGGYFSHRPLHKLAPEKVADAVSKIKREAENKKCESVFISSEEFVNSLWNDEIVTSIINALNDSFGAENVSILMIVRNHLTFVESTFAQFIKGGMFRTHMGNFFKKTDGDLLGYIDFFNKTNGFDFFSYSHFIEMYKSIAPDNKVKLLSIEKDDNAGKDVIEVLCDWFSLPYPKKENSRGNVNARYSEKSLLAMHYARKYCGKSDFIEKRRVINRVFALRGEGNSSIFSLSGDAYDRVKEVSAQDREYLVSNGYTVPEKVFSDIAGFPRKIDSITLNGEEGCAVRYLMETDKPDPARANWLADNAVTYLMEMCQGYEEKINSLEQRLSKLEKR